VPTGYTVPATTARAGNKNVATGHINKATTADIGISRKERARAKKLAILPQEKYDAIKSGQLALHKVDKPHIAEAGGEYEWYTPPEILDAVRKVMGAIDCDPASSDTANKTVKAETYYTEKDDGREKKWNGRVYMNPPFSQPEVADFCGLIGKKYKSKEITEACVLVNNATETAWAQDLMKTASAVCFPERRIRFLDPHGNQRTGALQGQMIVYVGEKSDEFTKHFKKFGIIWKENMYE